MENNRTVKTKPETSTTVKKQRKSSNFYLKILRIFGNHVHIDETPYEH